jgi:Lipoprotein signal peptidase
VRRLLLLGIIVLTLLVDQGTKTFVRATMREAEPRHYAGGLLTVLYAENPGAFLSLGSQLPRGVRRVGFDGVVGLGLLVAFWILVTGRMSGRGDDIALALVIGGGVGHLLDRALFHGVVTDFLYLSAGPLHTGVFNVADMAITGGVLWLALSSLWPKRKEEARA